MGDAVEQADEPDRRQWREPAVAVTGLPVGPVFKGAKVPGREGSPDKGLLKQQRATQDEARTAAVGVAREVPADEPAVHQGLDAVIAEG